MSSYRSLRAWQLAHELAVAVGRAVRGFPSHERFELSSQLRRASLSVPCNLVEGKARFGRREYLRHVRIAVGSLAEVDYLLFYALEMGYLTRADYTRLQERCRHLTILMNRLALRLQANGR